MLSLKRRLLLIVDAYLSQSAQDSQRMSGYVWVFFSLVVFIFCPLFSILQRHNLGQSGGPHPREEEARQARREQAEREMREAEDVMEGAG